MNRLSSVAIGAYVYLNVGSKRAKLRVVHKTASYVVAAASDFFRKAAFGRSNVFEGSWIEDELISFGNLLDQDILERLVGNPTLFTAEQVGFVQGSSDKYDYFPYGDAGKTERYEFWGWTKSPADGGSVVFIGTNGAYAKEPPSRVETFHPVLLLDNTLWMDENGNIVSNVAPTTPGFIDVPESVRAGVSFSVEWGESTDPDGNLIGYKLERSLNGGAYEQIYSGENLVVTDSVPAGKTTVKYRVRAFDALGALSPYRESDTVTVINNAAPSAPQSILLPATFSSGMSAVISWSASTDPDGNLSGYKLERNVNGGSFTQIYAGVALSYTDTVGNGWQTVQYRVKAYDPYAESAYKTSALKQVINNYPPVITCSYPSGSNLGTKSSGFTVSYSVDDRNAEDTITVTEKIDGVVKRTFTATRRAANSFQVTGEYFLKVLNGAHVMTIEATDGKATATYVLNFSKLVTTATVSLSDAIASSTKITSCAISVSGSFPSGSHLKIEVSNNAKDSSPVWEDCTSESLAGNIHTFSNASQTSGWAFNFRVTAERRTSSGGNIVSVQGGFTN